MATEPTNATGNTNPNVTGSPVSEGQSDRRHIVAIRWLGLQVWAEFHGPKTSGTGRALVCLATTPENRALITWALSQQANVPVKEWSE